MANGTKILFFSLLIIITNIYPQEYWLKLGNFSPSELRFCSFVDTLNGWAAGDSGVIIHTTNGGYNWTNQNTHIIEPISALQFINKRLGWGLAISVSPEFWGTIILKTTNGGLNWDTSRYHTSNIYFNALHFRDSLTGYLGSNNPAIIMKTTNAGVNWFECYIDTTTIFGKFRINKFRFLNDKFGMACGGIFDISGVIWKTTNFGNYWTADPVSYEPNFDIKIFDTNHIITVGGDYEYGASLTTTTNGGINWDWSSLEVMGIPRDLEFRTNSEGWSPLGYTPAFLKTNDMGKHWEIVNTPDSSQIFDMEFINNKFGICVGSNGIVLKFNSASVNIGKNQIETPEFMNLFQNYPNPFNPETKIDLIISDISYLELKVFNLLGQEIKILYSGTKLPGSYSIKFDGENIPSGIYFYKLYAKSLKNGNEINKTKKMILLK